MGSGPRSVPRRGRVAAALFAAVVLFAVAAPVVAGDDAPGDRETSAAVRSATSSATIATEDVAARLAEDPHPTWATITALECLAAVEDRLQRAVDERDEQGAKMFTYFEKKIARIFEDRAKYTDYRMMEIENRRLCGEVRTWAAARDAVATAARKAGARVPEGDEDAGAVAARVLKLQAMAKRPEQRSAVVGAVRGPAVRRLTEELHGWASAVSGRELAVAALGTLAQAPDLVDVARLRACAEADDPEIRRSAFRTLGAVGDAAAMDLLVERVGVEEGVPAGDVASWLHALTEQQFGTNAQAWKEWWDGARPGWRREAARSAQAQRIEREPYSRYFGLDLRTARVLFVVDRSASMSFGVRYKTGMDELAAMQSPSKMEVAVRELTQAIRNLDERTSFNVLSYGTDVTAWQRRPLRATEENREKAARWAAKLRPDGQTNLAGSLLEAFENTRPRLGLPDEAIADTLVVLSDGAPNCGPIAYDTDLLEELRRLNADRMVTIHSVFLGLDGDEAFMRSLAEDHGGKFVHHTE